MTNWSHLQICQEENTVTRDCQVGQSQATPLKSNRQSSVIGGNEPAGLSWDTAACPVLLSPTLLLEFPLLLAHGGAVCGRCLVAVRHREASGCSGEDWRVWPLLAHLPGISGKTGMAQLKLRTQSSEMKATSLHPAPSEGTKRAFTCRSGVHTFSRVFFSNFSCFLAPLCMKHLSFASVCFIQKVRDR